MNTTKHATVKVSFSDGDTLLLSVNDLFDPRTYLVRRESGSWWGSVHRPDVTLAFSSRGAILTDNNVFNYITDPDNSFEILQPSAVHRDFLVDILHDPNQNLILDNG